MNELDKKIREAMQNEDSDLFNGLGDDPGVFDLLLETVRGRNRWLNIMGAVWTILFLILGITSAVAFFRAETTRDLIKWASASILCMSAVAMLKVWYWLEIQRVTVMREIKRVELQIARLASRIQA